MESQRSDQFLVLSRGCILGMCNSFWLHRAEWFLFQFHRKSQDSPSIQPRKAHKSSKMAITRPAATNTKSVFLFLKGLFGSNPIFQLLLKSKFFCRGVRHSSNTRISSLHLYRNRPTPIGLIFWLTPEPEVKNETSSFDENV